MSKFLILSEGGDGCGLAMRLQSEGHDCRIWIREPDGEHRCEGLIQKTDDLTFGEIVLADVTGFGPIMDALRESGKPTFGGSSFHDRLETDRKFAKQVMEDCGITTPDSEYFEGPEAWTEAQEFIKEYNSRLVFKLGGRLSGVVPSYVSSDSEDLLQMLEYYKDKIGSTEPEFELQEFQDGVVVSTEGFFDGTKFLRPFNHTIERKQLMCGDLGPSGGCTGNVVWLVDDSDDPLVKLLLGLESLLAEHRYNGPIDLNAVVGDGGIYGLEFTPRFGYDAFPTFLLGLYNGDFGRFVSSLARGSDATLDVVDRVAAGVRVSIPPWPSEEHLAPVGIPVRGLTSGDLRFFYPYDVMLRKDELESSGGWGIIGSVNGVGDSVETAFEDAYRSVKHLKVPDLQYRTDLGEVCKRDYNKVARLLAEMV